ncbi:hypothetical protein HBHAL_3884 [Halobacillus halophilus DSM 2266]|uniref:Uncharacterized protein n=1 Tax=Halobacillus halophilus (strain ATCC 35676 / DSM 2266 / JCM 20832 / KCTC 3685 / LMG 17431 / NBRC 102448 / NCIMB 2269) TaxID=866895 RepID=I0JQ06_HALH3|nr:hypothetical protein HBHAL_3884 [Halobacillus halophilus DSM 2266]
MIIGVGSYKVKIGLGYYMTKWRERYDTRTL